VLTHISYGTDTAEKYKESGAFARMSDTLNRYLNDYSGYRKQSSDTEYKNLEDRMSSEQTRLQTKEDMYWSQFTRMEEFISQMNTQSNWLSQQFSSMNGNS
jgi:flagellar hook-associated protein 2